MKRGGTKDAVVASKPLTHPPYECGTTVHVELFPSEIYGITITG